MIFGVGMSKTSGAKRVFNGFTGLPTLKLFKFNSDIDSATKKTTELTNQLKGLQLKTQERINSFYKKQNRTQKDKFSVFNAPDICDWIESNIYDWTTVVKHEGVFDYSNAKLLKLDDYQKRILRHIFTPNEDGSFKYQEIIYSQPKKHGKTQIAAAVASWVAVNINAPNLIYSIASNREQSAGLIFNSAIASLHAMHCKVPVHSTSKPEILIPNGSVFLAIPSDYAGQAGGNYGATFWSELWTYKSERDIRFFEELPPVMTRKNSFRWIETYAGFENEDGLLLNIFHQFFKSTDEKELQPDVEIIEELSDIRTNQEKDDSGKIIPDSGRPSCLAIPKSKTFMFWDHEMRASWMNENDREVYRRTTRHATFVRLWENRWQPAEGNFMSEEMYNASLRKLEYDIDKVNISPTVLAGDASIRNDTTALCGVKRIEFDEKDVEKDIFVVTVGRIWNPDGKEIDLEETIATSVYNLHNDDSIIDIEGAFHYDEFQMHQVALNLKKLGIKTSIFGQGEQRVKADTFLEKVFRENRIVFQLIDPGMINEIKKHLFATKIKELENEQLRFVKGTRSDSRKIDFTIALSMALWKAQRKQKKQSNLSKLLQKQKIDQLEKQKNSTRNIIIY